MAWSVPRTWSNGEIVTQTMLNTDVRDNMRELWHELAYVEFTADVSTTTSIDVVSSGALTYIANPIKIEFYATSWTFNNATSYLALFDGVTDLGIIGHAGSSGGDFSGTLERRLTPSAASHTYKIVAVSAAAVTTTVRAGAGGAATKLPGFIRVTQRGS